MKFRDLDEHQKAMYRIMDEITTEYIGGYENGMMDYEVGSEDYNMCKNFLNQSHEELSKFFYDEIMRECCAGTNREHARFAGSEFLKERIEKRLLKWGY